ncbi:hypothetical protein JCM10213_008557 [Rhodosporidiobolus nylandii]
MHTPQTNVAEAPSPATIAPSPSEPAAVLSSPLEPPLAVAPQESKAEEQSASSHGSTDTTPATDVGVDGLYTMKNTAANLTAQFNKWYQAADARERSYAPYLALDYVLCHFLCGDEVQFYLGAKPVDELAAVYTPITAGLSLVASALAYGISYITAGKLWSVVSASCVWLAKYVFAGFIFAVLWTAWRLAQGCLAIFVALAAFTVAWGAVCALAACLPTPVFRLVLFTHPVLGLHILPLSLTPSFLAPCLAYLPSLYILPFILLAIDRFAASLIASIEQAAGRADEVAALKQTVRELEEWRKAKEFQEQKEEDSELVEVQKPDEQTS